MRLKVAKFTLLVVLVELLALYYSWKFISKFGTNPTSINITFNTNINTNNKQQIIIKTGTKHITKTITVILRSFELQENDVTLTIESVLNTFPTINVLIICDGYPYPPLDLVYLNSTNKNVKLINLSLNLHVPFKESYPLFLIKTKYVLFIPDSVRLTARQPIATMLSEIARAADKIVAAPIANIKNAQCLSTNLNLKEWTLRYKIIKNNTCDAVIGKHAILVETQILKKLANAFMMPFPESLYIQTTANDIKVKYVISEHLIHDGKQLLKSHHSQRRNQQQIATRQHEMYQSFAIKKVIQSNGDIEWYGCKKESPRCFGTVVDSMPSYLYIGKWTPPCCLANLRTVARHVFERLDESGIRYWLDGGSLLGAMRSGDILPWDYDIDVGINRDDITRCDSLVKAKNKQFVDSKGYVWEKATEGEFFRVHFSKVNRLYVNIFPFFSKNGTMTKDTWFTSHKNMEFPDLFLHPMSSIEFLGRQVPSPNNIRDFLELKYGKDVIENPQYPDPKKLKF